MTSRPIDLVTATSVTSLGFLEDREQAEAISSCTRERLPESVFLSCFIARLQVTIALLGQLAEPTPCHNHNDLLLAVKPVPDGHAFLAKLSQKNNFDLSGFSS